ncbi:mechanosensitive ion channel family protein [Pseudobacteriovorax antillogorgiicola]|uniref:Small-conductance mechanosensitive channel n=1 Tax=Pseudobacteriovorax antillogorgiicola TaxID=1513793 RepID=A0A1Y6CWS5_9BACT|nr:mechanosensitive ion channel domain-containing protein [Pseudobacteriovorax antillogorgiicola]TCS42123.1 small-conductance mechanosensitive channel [Pseudobacteriovorax antillogorgiicola]SMF82994.1 Small-conductance mechanosensitive channel [Pseudobacteriovorax antillogorgiicola]
MYKTWLKTISEISHISPEALENLITSTIVVLCYLGVRLGFKRYIRGKINSKKLAEVATEVIPSLLRLLLLGALLGIWLSGQASVASFFAVPDDAMEKVVASIYVYLAYIAGKLLGEAFIGIRYHLDVDKQYSVRKNIQISISILCVAALFKIWIATTADFSTYLGLLSAGIAIALQDVIVSLVGWIYLLTVRPFKIGDRIEIDGNRGDITDIKLLQFSMLETGNWIQAEQPTGRILSFPNSFVFRNMIANYNTGFDYIFAEMPIMVTFESNWHKSLTILEDIVKVEIGQENADASWQIHRAARTMRLSFDNFEPKVFTSVADSGVVLTLRFLCRVREKRVVEERVWKRVLDAFAKHDDIDFAYPTQRYYVNHIEGKAEAGGPAAAGAPVPT